MFVTFSVYRILVLARPLGTRLIGTGISILGKVRTSSACFNALNESMMKSWAAGIV